MKKQIFRSVATVLLFLSTYSICNGDFAVMIGAADQVAFSNGVLPTFNAGEQATLAIYGFNTATASPVTPQNFGFAFDISAPGSPNLYDGKSMPGSPSFFSAFSGSVVHAAGGNVAIDWAEGPNGLDASASPGHDLFIDISATSPITFAANPLGIPANGLPANVVRLATIQFNVSANTTSGTYGFKFVPGAQFDGGGNVNSITNDLTLLAGADGASFNQFRVSGITSVPEPSSFMLVAGIAGVAAWRIRRKRLGQKGNPEFAVPT